MDDQGVNTSMLLVCESVCVRASIFARMGVCVCVCVCVRERERERERVQ